MPGFSNMLDSFRRAGAGGGVNTGINPRASGGMPQLSGGMPPPAGGGMLSSLLPQLGAKGKIGASNPLATPPPGSAPPPQPGNNNPYQPWFMTGPGGPARTPAPSGGGGGGFGGGGMGGGLRAFRPGMGRMRRRLG